METIRVAAGLPVAALLPLSLPRIRQSAWQVILLSAIYAALTLAPVFPHRQSWLLLFLTTVSSLGAQRAANLNPDWTAQTQAQNRTALLRVRVREAMPLFVGIFLSIVAAMTMGAQPARRALAATLLNDRFFVFASGALAAIFLGGIAVSFVLSPFSRSLGGRGEDLPRLKNAGTYIGWLERALLFVFIFGGQPEAAAIALAAKSFARFPDLSQHHEGFAEYFLIGSLTSITIALVAAVATRVALGMKAL